MNVLSRIDVLDKYFENADVTDVKVFEGRATLRQFIAAMLSYYPWWLIMLYRTREILVRILGLVKHEEPDELPNLSPEEVSFTPGENVSFFIVQEAAEERFWVSVTPEDNHLTAYFGVVREPLDETTGRFHVFTTVYYKHWTGPVYFNIIRPFHHLVVTQMAKAGISR